MNEYSAEFIGTLLLILLGNGVVANVVLNKTYGHGGGWIVITAGWALGVFTGVIVAGPYSGAHLNPAVTVALALSGSFPWQQVLPFAMVQIAGAAIGSLLVWIVYNRHYEASNDPQAIKATFCTAPAIKSPFLNLFSEIIGTFVLIFAILHFSEPEINAISGEVTKVGMGSLGALPVTLIVFAIGLSLGGTTGYAINPARDLGPRIVHALVNIRDKVSSDWRYAWVPLLGPILGAALAVFLERIL